MKCEVQSLGLAVTSCQELTDVGFELALGDYFIEAIFETPSNSGLSAEDGLQRGRSRVVDGHCRQ